MSSEEPVLEGTPRPEEASEAGEPAPKRKKDRKKAKKALPSAPRATTAADAEAPTTEPGANEASADTTISEPQADSVESVDPPDSPDTPDTPDAPDTRDATEATEATDTPEAPEAPEAAEAVESTEAVEPAEEHEAAGAVEDNVTDEPAEAAEPAPSAPTPSSSTASATAPSSSSTSSGPELVDDPFVAADAAYGHHVDPVEGRAAWGRLLTMGRPRATRANLLVLLLAVVLGAAIAAQVQLTNERGLAELSQTDLVRVLDDVSLRSARLDQQVRELEATRDRLKSGTGTSAEALEQAQKRLDTLGILAGTIAAKGPGITLRISDPDNQVTGPVILDLIQELRDGGAEAIDVGGVRVVASSFVGDSGGEVKIDGTPVARPFVIKAIGDSKTLASAMTIPGGIVESVRQKGANATVMESDSIEITSTHAPTELTHAKPVE